MSLNQGFHKDIPDMPKCKYLTIAVDYGVSRCARILYQEVNVKHGTIILTNRLTNGLHIVIAIQVEDQKIKMTISCVILV